jgi:SAM-dependent methyltransferase
MARTRCLAAFVKVRSVSFPEHAACQTLPQITIPDALVRRKDRRIMSAVFSQDSSTSVAFEAAADSAGQPGVAYLFDQGVRSYGSTVVLAADQAGIVPLLLRHPQGLTAAELIAKLGLEPTVAAMTLPLLRQLRIVAAPHDDGPYTATAFAARHLDPDREDEYAGPWLRFADKQRERMDRLADYLTGRTPPPATIYLSPEQIMPALQALTPFSRATARAFVAAVDLSGTRHLLDVGAASAVWTIEVLRAVPGAQATVFDQAAMIPYTQKCVAFSEFADRIDVAVGDLFADDLPTGFDTIMCNALFHTWGPDLRAIGLQRCFQALEPGGVLYVCEHMRDGRPDPDPDVPQRAEELEVASMAGLLLLLLYGQGRSYLVDDFETALRTAGFVDVHARSLPGQPNASHVLSGRKPVRHNR